MLVEYVRVYKSSRADAPVLRSIPPDNPNIWDAGRWPTHERPVTHWGIGSQNWQPRAAPGKYTVRMTYNGKQYMSRCRRAPR